MGELMTEFDFTGIHVLCDISGVDPVLIHENELILDAVRRGIEESGATLCGMESHEFDPVGVTAVYVLSESHVSVHTYPEQRALFIDAFTCGTRCEPRRILDVVLETLGPCQHRTSIVHRGTPTRTLSPLGAGG